MAKYMCILCGFVYDEAVGHENIPAGTRWEDVPEDIKNAISITTGFIAVRVMSIISCISVHGVRCVSTKKR